MIHSSRLNAAENMADAPSSAPTTANGHASSDAIERVFRAQQAHRPVMRATDAAQRRAKIERLRRAMFDRREAIRDALYADFKKPPEEVDLTEVKVVAEFASFAEKNLDDWMAPDRVGTPLTFIGTRSEIHYEPRGVALIISPWNYPFNLTFGPLISALAAGNCAILKPSEYTPHSSQLMREMVEALFDEREVALFEGDKDIAQQLLALPFDHIHFTGSPEIGKIVMKAAAEHLTSVTLELGGKSPAIVDDTADVLDAASKIAWGKFTNVGQTCIAPDYVLVHDRAYDLFVDALQHNIRRFYGETPADQHSTPDYARIVNAKHYERLQRLYHDALHRGASALAGGQSDETDRYIAPTLLTDVPADADVMDEEIFGPLLPIVRFRAIDEALDRVNALPNPLSLYLFTDSPATENAVLSGTTAGTTAINDTLLQFFNPNLPFGGAGHSGIGKGSGYFGFKEFSNERAVLRRTAGSAIIKQLYPPYGPKSRKVIDWLVKYL